MLGRDFKNIRKQPHLDNQTQAIDFTNTFKEIEQIQQLKILAEVKLREESELQRQTLRQLEQFSEEAERKRQQDQRKLEQYKEAERKKQQKLSKVERYREEAERLGQQELRKLDQYVQHHPHVENKEQDQIQQALEASRRDQELEKQREAKRQEEQVAFEIALAESLREEKQRQVSLLASGSHNQIIAKLNEKVLPEHKYEMKDEYSDMTRDYLESLQKKNPSLSTLLQELKLSDDEEEKLNKFQDPIHFTIVTEPVRFNGKLYNLQTLLDCLGKKDPLTNKYTVTKSQIQPDWDIANELEQVLKTIKESRKKVAETHKETSTEAFELVKWFKGFIR